MTYDKIEFFINDFGKIKALIYPDQDSFAVECYNIDTDEFLSLFIDNSFDVVILNDCKFDDILSCIISYLMGL